MPIKPRVLELHNEIQAWRQDLHQNPELMFDTIRTGTIVAEKLTEFGCDEVVSGLAQTGVVGLIKGNKTTSGTTIGLRADMDALPIVEATNVPYISSSEGKMHACGHDGHTAMLLGAAKYLAETRNFNGTVAVIFQPAEEGGGGGKVMCDEGLMERFGINEVYGMHNMPSISTGEFAIRAGAFFAATDEFNIQVRGIGGHAAIPHHGVDTTLVAAHMVVALQSIVSRNTDPQQQLVVSVCTFRTETEASNIIPEYVHLRGTVRTLDAEVREMALARLQKIVKSTAETFGAKVEVVLKRGYPVMVNSPKETEFAAMIGAKVSDKATQDVPPIMGAEDFAYMLGERPGAYILVGNGDSAMLHHPEYDFNDDAIPAGASYWAELIETRIPSLI